MCVACVIRLVVSTSVVRRKGSNGRYNGYNIRYSMLSNNLGYKF